MKYEKILITSKNIEIIDGDRGKNYPKKSELMSQGDTLFLNNKNLISNRLDVSIGEYISKEKDALLRKGKMIREDIVLTTRGSIGNVGYFSKRINQESIRINSGMVIIRNKDESIYTPFLYLMLSSDFCKNQYFELSSGSVQVQLPIRDLKYLNILDIPLEKQKRIFEIIDSLDSKKELNSQMIDTLEEMASTLFKRWFVDFEFPDENGKPYKSSGGKMIDSELGEIPEGWEISSLGKVMDIKSGKRPKNKTSEKSIKSSIPIVGASKIMGYTSEALINESIITTGRVGTHGVIQRFREPVWVSDNSFIIKSKFEGFVYEILKNIDYRSLNRGSTQPLITQTDLKEEVIVYPSRKLLVKFESLYQNNYQMIFELTSQNVNLESVRDTLLPKLLLGEIEF
ncbi:MAG: restriction endonuclease subunit S [Vagococcus fluvialis]